ncbi:MAG: hypothetical protein IJQ73_08740 [Kiritimatiellae bacterium]|nr:hypothetical protein [Kiritimatiellia bacterium]
MTSSDVHSPEMQLSIRPFLHDVESSPDEQSIERALKLALRRLAESELLIFFAHAITSPLQVLPRKNGLEIQKVWISSPFS